MKIRTDIRARYARTLITSRVANPASRAQEVTFQVTIPETAFVSKFNMEVNGEIMEGKVRERSQAKQEYHQAVQSGQTAGHVATLSVRDSSKVQISVNVAAHSKATFNLTYEELLTRRKGRYELLINLNPGQVVRDMSVDVYIQETKGISTLKVPSIRLKNEIDFVESESVNDDAVVEWQTGQQNAHVRFAPTEEAQRRLGKEAGLGEKGLGGQFVVQYDAVREAGAGEVLAMDGYFVHFFSPPEQTPLPKHVIFVLDVSGSMHGHKIVQLREAMRAILGELQPKDYFNLIEFSDSVNVIDLETPENSTILAASNRWSGYNYLPGTEREVLPAEIKSFPANTEYIAKAQDIASKMQIQGGTNIHDSLKVALGVASRGVSFDGSDSSLPDPIIIFLTDGEATVGETRPDKILALLRETSSVPVFSLAFGQGADFKFLKRLSLLSDAFARKIYEAADSTLQLRDFYRQIASPMLSNISFSYLDSQVTGKLRENNTQQDQIIGGEIRALSENGATSYYLQTPVIDEEKQILETHEENTTVEIEMAEINATDEVQTLPNEQKLIIQSESVVPRELVVPELSETSIIPNLREESEGADRFLERLWAFLTIRQQLERYEADGTEEPGSEAEAARNKAVEMAVKFQFVTSVTSFVVVKSDNATTQENSTVATLEAESGDRPAHGGYSAPLGGHYDQSVPLSGVQNYAIAMQAPPVYHSKIASHYYAPSVPVAMPGPPPAAPQYFAPVAQDDFEEMFDSDSDSDSVPHIQPEDDHIDLSLNRSPQAETFSDQSTTPIDLTVDTTLTTPIPISTTEKSLSMNLTLVNIETISWLTILENLTSSEGWQTVRIGELTDTYKLLNANQNSTLTGESCKVSAFAGNCRPLADCVLAGFATDVQLFIDSFKCSFGAEEFLGACCPSELENTQQN
ncbi:hypothetical protein B566_EDAN011590 [Ephemera danica]|nr:hypothetical protein B566_EDAN011590 [Ephemera danica]